MPINPDIEALLSLHNIDSQIQKLTDQKELLPVTLRRIEAHLAQQRQLLEEKRVSIKQLRARMHEREVDLKAAEEEIEKLSNQLNRAQTNKEYAAFQHEIAAKKADASRIEDDLLALMADADDLDADAHELERRIAQLDRQYAEEAQGVTRDVAKVERDIAALRKARGAAAGKVNPELLEEYERIAAKKGASAMAPVVGNSCQGCFMQLPPELCHVVRGGRRVVRCPSCSRLLYLPDQV